MERKIRDTDRQKELLAQQALQKQLLQQQQQQQLLMQQHQQAGGYLSYDGSYGQGHPQSYMSSGYQNRSGTMIGGGSSGGYSQVLLLMMVSLC